MRLAILVAATMVAASSVLTVGAHAKGIKPGGGAIYKPPQWKAVEITVKAAPRAVQAGAWLRQKHIEKYGRPPEQSVRAFFSRR